MAEKRLHELAVVLPELGCGQAGGAAQCDHINRAGARALNVARQKKRIGQQWIAGNRGVRTAQRGETQGRRQMTGIPYLQTVGEKHDLNGRVGSVVAVGDGVDDGFGDGVAGNFVIHRHVIAHGAGADRAVEFGHHKIDRLIDEFEGRAFIDLVRRDGLAHFRAVKMKAFDLGSD